jgi:hypothetical protein
MPGGSHNRNTKQSLRHVLNSAGKSRLCKCPLHRNGGKGTLVLQTKFKRHGKAGIQGMCADGKTFIDSYSHMLKRLQLLAVSYPNEINVAFKKAPVKYGKIINNIKNIINKVLNTSNNLKLSENNFKLQLLTQLDKALKTKQTGMYDIEISPKNKLAFNEYLKNIFTPERRMLMLERQSGWTKGGFVKDSKDGKLYPVEEFAFNISKKREFYDSSKKLTPYRINIHNTRVRGGRSSTLRGEMYLADGEYTEANRRMKKLGKGKKNIHADHFIPLALGGIHDVKNLRGLLARKNLYKKDRLTPKGFELLKSDVTYLSKHHHKVFNLHKEKDIDTVQAILKMSVFKLRNKVTNMSTEKKLIFIGKFYPHYKDSQINRIIRKHFIGNEN